MMEILFSILDCFEIYLFFYFINGFRSRKFSITIPIIILFGYLNFKISNLSHVQDFNIEIFLSILEVIMLFICLKKVNSLDLILLILLSVISIIEVFGIILFEQYILKIQLKSVEFSICVHVLRCFSFFLFAKYVKGFVGKYGFKPVCKTFYMLLPILILMLLLLQGYYLYGMSEYYSLVLFSTMIVGISTFIIVKQQFITKFENDKLRLLEKVIDYTAEQNKEQVEKAKEIRKIKHDMISNLGTVQCLINENKIEESMTYISRIIGEISKINTITYTKYQYLNALLNFKKNSFPKISFDFQLYSLDLSMDMEFDCCTIITNLLDNAIDEVNRNQKNFQQVILRIKDKNGNIIITAENDLEKYKSLNTEKKQKDEHGLGLSIIEAVVKKYSGEIIIQQDDRFKVSLFLRKPCGIDNELT